MSDEQVTTISIEAGVTIGPVLATKKPQVQALDPSREDTNVNVTYNDFVGKSSLRVLRNRPDDSDRSVADEIQSCLSKCFLPYIEMVTGVQSGYDVFVKRVSTIESRIGRLENEVMFLFALGRPIDAKELLERESKVVQTRGGREAVEELKHIYSI